MKHACTFMWRHQVRRMLNSNDFFQFSLLQIDKPESYTRLNLIK